MRTLLHNTLKVLSPVEKRKFLRLLFFDFAIVILDILFLLGLLYVVNFYTTEPKPNDRFARFFTNYPLLLITGFFILFALKNFAAFLIVKWQYNFLYQAASRISADKLLEYLHGDYSQFIEIDSSVHIHRIKHQPIEFCHYVLKGIMQVTSQVLLLVLTLIAVIAFDARLFLLLFIMLMPPVLLVSYLLKKNLHAARTSAKSASIKTLQYLNEALSGFIESNLYNKNQFFSERYYTHQKKLNKHLADQQIIQNIPPRLIEVFAILGLFILVLINATFTNVAFVSIITIGAFLAASYKIIPGVVKIINAIGQVKTYSHTAADLAWKPVNKHNNADQPKSINSFELNNVSFRYKNIDVLNRISLKAQQGEFIGLSGASGKGKTTILNVLMGLVTPAKGSMAFNGETEVLHNSYWKNISYVKQQPFIINDTIRNNITLNETAADDTKLLNLVEITGIDKINPLSPNILDSEITEHGKNLSGGQRQRIALARALYKEFDLLILDEPFSELDEESEMWIMKYLKELSDSGKMIVLITHNTKALSFCSRTISMDELN